MKYYEEYPKKKKKRRRRGCLGALVRFFVKLIAVALVLALAAAAVLYFLPPTLFMVETDVHADLSLTTGLPNSPVNVLVLGVDALSKYGQRSDTMMVASIDRDALRLTSIQRDMRVDIPGHGVNKINSAYNFGGPELAMRVVNEALGLNIMKYVVVDFTILVRLVDALGGVNMDITEGEMEHINKNVLLSGKVFQPLGYTYTELTEYGENVHLNGLQTLAYARIRKLDSDYMRTSRQRKVINVMLHRLKEQLWNPVVVFRFLKEGLSGIQTNLSVPELMSLGEKGLFSGEIRQLRLPADGTFNDDGSALSVYDWPGNVSKFREFVYGE